MHIDFKVVLGVLVGGYATFKMWWARIEPTVKPIIEEAEQMALDGTIDMADRKKLVMDTIAAFQINGTIKLNWIEQLVVSKIVDIVASHLPDFKVSQDVKNVIKTISQK